MMIVLTGDCIVSSLGFSTQDNFEAVSKGQSGVQPHGSYMGSRLDRKTLDKAFARLTPSPAIAQEARTYSLLEKAMIVAADGALRQAAPGQAIQALASSDRTLFFVSTTKGNVELLAKPAKSYAEERVCLWQSAQWCAQFFGNTRRPVVVSNACISGVCAQIAALRALQSGECDTAVVLGADVLSPFIISGFQSFKALSAEPCRPFDAQRCGLNLGEAAAAMVWSRTEGTPRKDDIVLVDGAIANDANHISGPSRTAEGLTNCLKAVLAHFDQKDLAFINAHGTATLYNDEMEALALHRCALDGTPINSLKPYFGHTLGAAGVLESILDAHFLREGLIFSSLGYDNNGVTNRQNVATTLQKTAKPFCIKMLSGFGGSNAVLVLGKGPKAVKAASAASLEKPLPEVAVTATVSIDNGRVACNGRPVAIAEETNWLTGIYKYLGEAYPKFHKMDRLSKLGWIAANLLLKETTLCNDHAKQDTAVILFNRNASLDDDMQYQSTLDPHAYFPSPAVFVYTLANIVTGEIAIRHKIFGETSFYIDPEYDREEVLRRAAQAFAHTPTLNHIVCGWVEYAHRNGQAYVMMVDRTSPIKNPDA